MQELRFVLIIVGVVAIATVLLHGFWSSKKDGRQKFGNAPTKQKDKIQAKLSAMGLAADEKKESSTRQEPMLEPSLAPDPLSTTASARFSHGLDELDAAMQIAEPSVVQTSPRSITISFEPEDLPATPHHSEAVHADGNGQKRQGSASVEAFELDDSINYSELDPRTKVESLMPSDPGNAALSAPSQVNKFTITEPASSAQDNGPSLGSDMTSDVLLGTVRSHTAEITPSADNPVDARTINADALQGHPIADEPTETVTQVQSTPSEQAEDPLEVIVLNVHSMSGDYFSGTQLFKSLATYHLYLGEMDIFHRHQYDDGSGKVIFSIANMMQPGTLITANPSTFLTKGISFFMTMPCCGDPEQNFKFMLQTAQRIADDLGANVLDAERNMLTPSKLDEYRKQVQTFKANQYA